MALIKVVHTRLVSAWARSFGPSAPVQPPAGNGLGRMSLGSGPLGGSS